MHILEEPSALGMWERACPANTGCAGAIHRGVCFAGQARSHNACAGLNVRCLP